MWLHLPTSCLCAPAAEDSTSGSDVLFATLARSATWKTKSLPAASWRRAWKTAGWTTRLFGQTYEPSTARRGVDSWTASLAATRASRSPTQGVDWDRTTLATYGPKSPGLQPRLNLDWSSSRTSVLTCGSDSVKSPEAFKVWATALRRHCLQRRKSALLMAESDCSSWPTARSTDGTKGGQPREKTFGGLAPAAAQWPTPQAHDSQGPKTPEQIAAMRERTGAGVSNLNERVSMWQTPTSAAEAPNLGSNIRNGPKSLLAQAQAVWQTPSASTYSMRRQPGKTERNEPLLPKQAEQWATPTSRDWKDGANPSAEVATNSLLGRQAPRTQMPGDESLPSDRTSRRRLNPRFVEWLMGWPEGWVDLTSSTSSGTA